jgi:hypothetical protein
MGAMTVFVCGQRDRVRLVETLDRRDCRRCADAA